MSSNKSKISPCLWFNGQAEEAAKFYVSLFEDGKILYTSYYEEGHPFPSNFENGTALVVEFSLAGQTFQALNGGPEFTFNEAMSLSIRTKDQAETDKLWEGLTKDGGSPGPCGWLKDKFGVSWQITPEAFYDLENAGNKAGKHRMWRTMMTQQKLDLAALEKSYHGTDE